MTATTMNLGFFTSGCVFAVLIAIPTFAWWRLRMNAILAFWFAYIVTRPLGASFSDRMAVPRARSGLGWGDGPVSFVLLVAIVALVGFLTIARPDVDERGAGASPSAGDVDKRFMTGTTRDRAACTQLGNAYASFNASNGGKRPSATYQAATATAKQADNPQLRAAIPDWVGVMASPESGKSATGAPYAAQECRLIGQPLSFGSPTQSPLPSISSPTPTDAGSPTTRGDNEAGDGGD